MASSIDSYDVRPVTLEYPMDFFSDLASHLSGSQSLATILFMTGAVLLLIALLGRITTNWVSFELEPVPRLIAGVFGVLVCIPAIVLVVTLVSRPPKVEGWRYGKWETSPQALVSRLDELSPAPNDLAVYASTSGDHVNLHFWYRSSNSGYRYRFDPPLSVTEAELTTPTSNFFEKTIAQVPLGWLPGSAFGYLVAIPPPGTTQTR
jgi:hypothetical protein